MLENKAFDTREADGFGQVLRAAWAAFRARRGWTIGIVITALVTMLPGLLLAALVRNSCDGPNGNVCPTPPVGPGGQAVDDRFYFVYQPLAGDGSITVRVTSLTGIITYPPPNHDQIVAGVVPWAKAGIMIKERIEPGADYAAVMVTGSHGVRMQHTFTEDHAGTAGGVTAESPRWLRLARAGSTLTGYESIDGAQWTTIGTAQLAELPDTVQIGLFVTSPCDLTVAQRACRFTQASAVFDQVGVAGQVPGTWSRADVGDDPGMMTDWERYHRASGLVESGGTFTVTGTGDIAPLISDGGWPIERILIGAVFGAIGVIIVAVLFSTAAYRRSRIDPDLLASAQPGRVLAAQAIVIGAVSFGASLIAAGVAVVLGTQLLRANGTGLLLVTPFTELRIVVGTAALLAVTAVFALALGAWFRRSVPAIIIALVAIVLPYLLAVSTALPGAASEWLLRLTPAAAFAIQQSRPLYPQVISVYDPAAGYYPLPPWAGFAVLCGYTALVLGLAVRQLRRRDTYASDGAHAQRNSAA